MEQPGCASDPGARAGCPTGLVPVKATREVPTRSPQSLEAPLVSDRDGEDRRGNVSERWQENESGSGEELPAINHHEE